LNKSTFSIIGKSISVLHFQKQKNVAVMMSKYKLGSVSYGFLSYLKDREGITQRELCSVLYIDDALASRAMGTLVRKGFIKRLRSKTDARSYELYLTEKGKEVLPELLKMYEDWWKKITAGISQEKLDVLCSVLKDISEQAIGQELFPKTT
jgi:DNA-binding MarR family transcriptional regulator